MKRSLEEDPIIKLNVGGKIFETRKSTLTRFPDTYLGGIFSEFDNHQDVMFFDRSYEYFDYILNYYRNGFVEFPSKIEYNSFNQELIFCLKIFS